MAYEKMMTSMPAMAYQIAVLPLVALLPEKTAVAYR